MEEHKRNLLTPIWPQTEKEKIKEKELIIEEKEKDLTTNSDEEKDE
jgi:hypothetical protein